MHVVCGWVNGLRDSVSFRIEGETSMRNQYARWAILAVGISRETNVQHLEKVRRCVPVPVCSLKIYSDFDFNFIQFLHFHVSHASHHVSVQTIYVHFHVRSFHVGYLIAFHIEYIGPQIDWACTWLTTRSLPIT